MLSRSQWRRRACGFFHKREFKLSSLLQCRILQIGDTHLTYKISTYPKIVSKHRKISSRCCEDPHLGLALSQVLSTVHAYVKQMQKSSDHAKTWIGGESEHLYIGGHTLQSHVSTYLGLHGLVCVAHSEGHKGGQVCRLNLQAPASQIRVIYGADISGHFFVCNFVKSSQRQLFFEISVLRTLPTGKHKIA